MNFLKEGTLSRVDLESWRVKSLSIVEETYQRCFPSPDLLIYSIFQWFGAKNRGGRNLKEFPSQEVHNSASFGS
jgi:hypothetical protein